MFVIDPEMSARKTSPHKVIAMINKIEFENQILPDFYWNFIFLLFNFQYYWFNF